MAVIEEIDKEKGELKMVEPVTEERIAELCTKMWHEQIMGAVARGWCGKGNSHKTMDSDLAMGIVSEVEALLRTDIHPKLGCATTRQLLEELFARLDIDLDYRTINN